MTEQEFRDFGTANVVTSIRLRSGHYFDLADPKPDQFTLTDIAGALSKICRYGGQINSFYCPTPDQRILTADLRWVPAGELTVGTELLAFDETPHELGAANNRRRRFRPSAVVHNIPVKREVYCLEMEDGSVVKSSAEHPWLVATKQSRNQAWVKTEEIAAAVESGSKRYMHRFFSPWSVRKGWKVGWLAGMYDGEGYLSYTNRGGVTLGVSQREGPLLDQLSSSLVALGFNNLSYNQTGTRGSGVVTLQMRGGWREIARLLGVVRPYRLLDKFSTGLRAGLFGKQLDGKGLPLQIIGCRSIGKKWVSGIETTTHTYFCEGFGAHNSVAEHCCHCAEQAERDGLSKYVQRVALMHDASEAFCGDVVKPLKNMLGDSYKKIDDAVERVIKEKYDLYGTDEWTAAMSIDMDILIAEKRVLFSPDQVIWRGEENRRRVDVPFRLWRPQQAEKLFLMMAEVLGVSD